MDSLLDGSTTVEPEQFFTELVGEGKKFKDQEELAKGKYESDLYIQTLTRQLDDLRKDYLKEREENTTRAKLQELIDQTKSLSSQQIQQPIQRAEEKPQISPNEIKSLVSSTVQEIEIAKKRDQNFNLVRDRLTERYGKDYNTSLGNQLKALDISVEEANELARTKPQLLLKTLGLDQPIRQENFRTPPTSTQNSSAFKPVVQKRTWSYYQEMKAKNPKEYFSAKNNVQMHNDAMSLGEEFMDGDYNASDRELIKKLY